jgi:hypothetical protein
MTRYFTHYWANDTAEKAQTLGEDRLEYVAGNGFVWRGVSVGGVLTWQSQPRQGLDDRHVRRLIEHDELRNSIYLFFRPRMRGDYIYLGQLKYLSHDAEREHPVHFQWQILDWNLPEEVRRRVVSGPQPPTGPSGRRPAPLAEGELQQAPTPTGGDRRGTGTPRVQGTQEDRPLGHRRQEPRAWHGRRAPGAQARKEGARRGRPPRPR